MDKLTLAFGIVLAAGSAPACGPSAPPASDKPTAEIAAAKAGDKPSEKTDEKAAKPAAPDGTAIPAPSDVAAPPADAQKTASGLASKVLAPGSGDKKPSASDKVKVHYTGWTTDGKMFDSSVQRGNPATFDVKGVIAGWTEGLQLMTVGERRRLWIPEKLAYQGRPTDTNTNLKIHKKQLE